MTKQVSQEGTGAPLDIATRFACDVCGRDALGVTSSSLGAISFAYCRDCATCGAEPYLPTVAMVAMQEDVADTGAILDTFAPWFHEVLFVSVLRAGKTAAEFWADVIAVRAMDALRVSGGEP